MTSRLAGKSAFVTGAAQGIGLAIATEFQRQGATVVAADINEAALESVARDHALTTCVLDVTDGAMIVDRARVYTGTNVLVNCSGIVANGAVLDCTDGDWDSSLAVNATAIFHTIAAFLPGMLEQGGGSIINIASVVSSLQGAINRFAYGASKGAVLGITKSVAIDYIERGIRCNAICPGTVRYRSACVRPAIMSRPARLSLTGSP